MYPATRERRQWRLLTILVALLALPGVAALPNEDDYRALHRAPRARTVNDILVAHAGEETTDTTQRLDYLDDPDDAQRRLEEARRQLFATDGLLVDERPPAVTARALEIRLLDVVRKNPAVAADAYHLLAALSFRDGRSRRSLRYAARAALARPSSSRYLTNVGYFLQSQEHYLDAHSIYQKARRLDPNNTAAHLGLLSLSPHLPELRPADLRDLLGDWARRERVPSLRRLARDLNAVLSDLLESTDEDSVSDFGDTPDVADLESIRELLATFFGPSSPQSTPGSPQTSQAQRSTEATPSRSVGELKFRVGDSRRVENPQNNNF